MSSAANDVPDLGPEVRRFYFAAPFVVAFILGLLGAGFIVGYVTKPRNPQASVLLIGIACLVAAFTSLVVAPKTLRVCERGLDVHRGFTRERVPFARITRVYFGSPGGDRRGVYVYTGPQLLLSVFTGNSGTRTARAIADLVAARAGLDARAVVGDDFIAERSVARTSF